MIKKEKTGDVKLSRTIRIDLIPEIPEVTTRRSVVFSSPTQKHRRAVANSHAAESVADERFNELLQSIYDAALITRLDGKIADVNVRAVEFLVYSREELCAMTVFDVISGSDESLIQSLRENLENERFTIIEAYCIRKDGTFFPAEISVNMLRTGEMQQMCFFIRDITIRRQAQEMLRTEHNAIQNSGNGIAVGDPDAMIEYVNPAVARMWGYENPDDLLGQDFRSLLADREAASQMIESVLKNHQTWIGEMVALRSDGAQFDVQVSAASNRNSEGEAVGVVFSFVDIGDRKRAEEAEREAERTRVMLESLGAACHHLGQPATVLLANLGIIQRKIKTEDPMVVDLVNNSLEAVEGIGDILHKLNAVDEYKTTQYLDKVDGVEGSDNRIIEI